MQLSIQQMACALDLPQGKIERWIRQGRIPLVRRDHMCTFDRQTLERWASQHNLEFHPDRKEPPECVLVDDTRLSTALQNGGIHHGLAGRKAVDVFRAAVAKIDFIPEEQKTPLVQKLEEREALTSTGIGKGIALPHPREPESLGLEHPAVAACFLSNPIDFQALDGRPVDIMFILLSPTVKIHLQLLSKLSYCLRQEDFVAFLQQTPGEDALITRLDELEALCEQGDRR